MQRPSVPARLLPALLVGALTLALTAPPAQAQSERILPALIGGALGLGVGGYVSIGIWSYKAHAQNDYLFNIDDALGWETTPVLIGAATGATVGWISQERLRNAAFAGIGAGVVGTVVGAIVGNNVWQPPEGRWAGGVLGGGVGLVAGSVAGMFWPTGEDDPAAEGGVPVQIRIPVGF